MHHPLLWLLRVFDLKRRDFLFTQFLSFALSARLDLIRRNTVCNEIAFHELGSPLTELQVEVPRPTKIRMPNNHKARVVVGVLFVFLEAAGGVWSAVFSVATRPIFGCRGLG